MASPKSKNPKLNPVWKMQNCNYSERGRACGFACTRRRRGRARRMPVGWALRRLSCRRCRRRRASQVGVAAKGAQLDWRWRGTRVGVHLALPMNASGRVPFHTCVLALPLTLSV